MKTHAKCHKDGHHRQSAAMTKNREQDHQNGKTMASNKREGKLK
jgi:hypothetical protein